MLFAILCNNLATREDEVVGVTVRGDVTSSVVYVITLAMCVLARRVNLLSLYSCRIR